MAKTKNPKSKTSKPQPKKAAGTKAAKQPPKKQALTFKEVRFLSDVVGQKVKLICPLLGFAVGNGGSVDAIVKHVDLNAGMVVLKIRDKSSTYLVPIDQVAIGVG